MRMMRSNSCSAPACTVNFAVKVSIVVSLRGAIIKIADGELSAAAHDERVVKTGGLGCKHVCGGVRREERCKEFTASGAIFILELQGDEGERSCMRGTW